jgi:MFS family permease
MILTRNPSLYWPPIYRPFLTGGRDRFRLTRTSIAALAACAALLALAVPTICAWGGHPTGPLWPWLVVVATLQAICVAALAAHWLGDRAGLLAGLVQLVAASLLPNASALTNALFCLAFSVAMGAFMVAQVPGPAALADRPPQRWIFFLAAGITGILAGPVALALIFAVCGCYLASTQDRRGLPFLIDRQRLATLGLLMAIGLIVAWWIGQPNVALREGVLLHFPAGGHAFMASPGSWGTSALWLALFAPLVLPALCSGLRNGHYATPFWRFQLCWSLGPLALLAVGQFRCDLHLGMLLPALAITSAVTLENLLRRTRR